MQHRPRRDLRDRHDELRERFAGVHTAARLLTNLDRQELRSRFCQLGAGVGRKRRSSGRISDSVLARGAEDVLAVTTSMHDLLVPMHPVAESPIDVVAVRAPKSMPSASPGMVQIEYLGGTGRDTVLERPQGEAVLLKAVIGADPDLQVKHRGAARAMKGQRQRR